MDLFLTFAKVGVCTFGGGYAMLPILQREVVEKKGWVTEEEVTDYFAIGQCTPGIIAVNTSVFIGHRQRGVPGGIAAALGVVFPSFVVITIIAAFLTKFATYPVVQHALAGINAAVVALIAVSVLKLGKTNLRGRPAVCIFLGVLVLGELSGLLAVDPATPLGAVRRDQWLYLGPPELSLEETNGLRVEWNGLRFAVRAAQPVCVGEETLYWWALLAVEDGEAQTEQT